MEMQQNLTVVWSYFDDIWNQQDFDAADRYLSKDYVSHGPLTEGFPPGPANQREFVQEMLTAFPDVRCQLDKQEGIGEMVRLWLTFCGTNTGPLFGQPATGEVVVVHLQYTARVANGKLVEGWADWDPDGLVYQLTHR